MSRLEPIHITLRPRGPDPRCEELRAAVRSAGVDELRFIRRVVGVEIARRFVDGEYSPGEVTRLCRNLLILNPDLALK